MPKLYTKTGDKGTTSLYDGSRQKKSRIFFDVLGDLDELASHIGLLCAKISEKKGQLNNFRDSVENGAVLLEEKISITDGQLDRLREIQVKLLDIGSNVAVVDETKKGKVPKFSEDDVKCVEKWIDDCEEKNTKLTEFLLTGVGNLDSQCHVCRSVSRRAERGLWKLYDRDIYVDANILKYMNRLSDFFFAFARHLTGGHEIKVSDIKKLSIINGTKEE